MKILIADDDLVSTKILKKNINDWGYGVVTAKNGEAAWQIIITDEIRLAILDWMMPGIDGVELCRKIRQKFQEGKSKYTYIILLTSRDQEEDIIYGLSAGADDYMTKPTNLHELKVRIQNGMRIITLEDDRIKLASYDHLTGLWYRYKIVEFLEDELNRGLRENLYTGVIMVDIDGFKRVNDTYGHFVGDEVLCRVTSRLKNQIRRYDKIGRYGGDEILIVLPNCNQKNVKLIGERLRHIVCDKKIKTKSGSLSMSISLGGISSELSPQVSADCLVKTSDKALFNAKKKGRNYFFLADSL